MSCYNAESHVSNAIESIINQTFSNFEFIIIDDGSKDNTLTIIGKFADNDGRIIFLKNERNMGLASSLNRGIKMAKGEYIARMDADDFSLNERLKKQVEFLDKNPNIDILGSNAIMVQGNKEWVSDLPLIDNEVKKERFTKTCLIHPTVMLRKTCFEQGEYDPNLPWAEDKDLWLRWTNTFTFANLSDSLIKYTVKDKITWKIFYYNHLVLIKNMRRQNILMSQLPHIGKSIASHLIKMVKT